MKKTFFAIPDEEGVILTDAIINCAFTLSLAVDTAASQTTLDKNMLAMFGFSFDKSLGKSMVETSNGVILVDTFLIESIEILGVNEKNLIVAAYDFIAHGITPEYDGVLGLDFLRKRKFCIDVEKGEITVVD
jgi:predicted aspartyl protease